MEIMVKHKFDGKSVSIFFLFFALLFTGCVSSNKNSDNDKLQYIIDNSCFEVVVKRPSVDSLTYEKELPWDNVDYNIRNDDYLPLGTAFAVSENQFVTAAHVMDLANNSLIYKEYFIRDSRGEVFPIENLQKFHASKDFVIFTSYGTENKTYLKVREGFEANEPVYQVGNIYGQGLVAVPGTVLGHWAEPDNGEWNLIKSSPPNDRGSSGGPLLDQNLNVVGIIVMKDENFSYSLPMSELASSPDNKGIMDFHSQYMFNLMPGEQSDAVDYYFEVDLPLGVSEVKELIHNDFLDEYTSNMQAFLDSPEREFFPMGKTSLEALHSNTFSNSIQVLYKNQNDKRWVFSKLEKTRGELPDNGRVLYSAADGTFYIDLIKPESVSHEELYDDPKMAMDLILKGINFPRTFSGEEIRILSFGSPFEEQGFDDSYGRKWFRAIWKIEFSDQAVIFMYTPTPRGLVGALRFISTSIIDTWTYDLEITADLIYIPYVAALEDWKGFLEQDKYLYGAFRDMTLNYEQGKYLNIDSDEFTLELDSEMFLVDDRMGLTLNHDFMTQDGKVIWSLRRILTSENNSENFFVSYKFLKPVEGLSRGYYEEWEDFITESHPYSEAAHSEGGRTNIATIHPSFSKDDDGVFSLYIGMEGSFSQEEMIKKLDYIKNGLRFK